MDILKDDKHLIIPIDGGVGDEITFARTADGVYVEIAEPFKGDSNTGIGALTGVTLTPEHVEILKAWLNG